MKGKFPGEWFKSQLIKNRNKWFLANGSTIEFVGDSDKLRGADISWMDGEPNSDEIPNRFVNAKTD